MKNKSSKEFTPEVVGAYLRQRLENMSPSEFREMLRRYSPELLEEEETSFEDSALMNVPSEILMAAAETEQTRG